MLCVHSGIDDVQPLFIDYLELVTLLIPHIYMTANISQTINHIQHICQDNHEQFKSIYI